MGTITKIDDVVLLFENYSSDSEKLHTSFKLAGKNYPVVVIEEDGFLPDDVISVFGYFLGEFKEGKNIPGKPRYFNQIKVPAYWEISGTNSSGKIHNLNKERGRIYYTEPRHKRLVRVVDWCDDRGVVRSSDHYNKYGALYARTIFNAKEQKVNKTYFSASGAEIIMENYVTGDIILNDGDMVRIFKNKTEFTLFFMERTGYAERRIFFNTLSIPFFVSQRLADNGKGDILFWQEPARPDIPGNMQIILSGEATRTAKIMVQKKESYEKLLELGASANVIEKLGFIYPFKKENGYKPEALICTNSDRVAQLQKLVQELPEVHFHIAALTEMSSKLMDMESYSNVSLYPGVKSNILKELFRKCDIYLDINHEAEIVSAVQKAFLYNQLIFAFKETLHNATYVAEEHIYPIDNVEQMISDIRTIVFEQKSIKKHLELQYTWALLENVEKYAKFV